MYIVVVANTDLGKVDVGGARVPLLPTNKLVAPSCAILQMPATFRRIAAAVIGNPNIPGGLVFLDTDDTQGLVYWLDRFRGVAHGKLGPMTGAEFTQFIAKVFNSDDQSIINVIDRWKV